MVHAGHSILFCSQGLGEIPPLMERAWRPGKKTRPCLKYFCNPPKLQIGIARAIITKIMPQVWICSGAFWQIKQSTTVKDYPWVSLRSQLGILLLRIVMRNRSYNIYLKGARSCFAMEKQRKIWAPVTPFTFRKMRCMDWRIWVTRPLSCYWYSPQKVGLRSTNVINKCFWGESSFYIG